MRERERGGGRERVKEREPRERVKEKTKRKSEKAPLIAVAECYNRYGCCSVTHAEGSNED